VAIHLSQAVNLTERLGFDGPAHKSNSALLSAQSVSLGQLHRAARLRLARAPDSSHQYYRRSSKARDDIARAFNRPSCGAWGIEPCLRSYPGAEDRNNRNGISVAAPIGGGIAGHRHFDRPTLLPPQVGSRSARQCAQSRGETLRGDPRGRGQTMCCAIRRASVPVNPAASRSPNTSAGSRRLPPGGGVFATVLSPWTAIASRGAARRCSLQAPPRS